MFLLVAAVVGIGLVVLGFFEGLSRYCLISLESK